MKYSEGFKAQAVAKVLDNHGRSINEVASDLNVYPATLSNWIKQAKEGKLRSIEGDSIPESVNIVVVIFDMTYATSFLTRLRISAEAATYFLVTRLPHRCGYFSFAASKTALRSEKIA